MTIVRNSARCKTCDVEIESEHRHDFKTCPGMHIFVDGGRAYLRRGGLPEHLQDTSIVVTAGGDEA